MLYGISGSYGLYRFLCVGAGEDFCSSLLILRPGGRIKYKRQPPIQYASSYIYLGLLTIIKYRQQSNDRQNEADQVVWGGVFRNVSRLGHICKSNLENGQQRGKFFVSGPDDSPRYISIRSGFLALNGHLPVRMGKEHHETPPHYIMPPPAQRAAV